MMNTQDKPLSKKSGTSSLLRPQFSPGLLLEDDDLNTGVSYTRDLTRLMFRSLFGCGVICGLTVTGRQTSPAKLEITVAKGLALDCMGNPIEVPSDVVIEYCHDCSDIQLPIWVVVCYKESCCRPKEVACSQDDDSAPRPTRVRSGYEVRVYGSLPACSCHCRTSDDTPPKTLTGGCCEDDESTPPDSDTPSIRYATTGVDARICPCYLPHFHGKCECGCNCCCVVIGKITEVQSPDPNKRLAALANGQATVDYAMVRHIRPMLNGYFMCKPERKKRLRKVDDIVRDNFDTEELEAEADEDDGEAMAEEASDDTDAETQN